MVKKVPTQLRTTILQHCWRIHRPKAQIIKWFHIDDGFAFYLETPPGQPDFGIIYKAEEEIITLLDTQSVRHLFKREHHFDTKARK